MAENFWEKFRKVLYLVIQGGMGIAVSGWKLARTWARAGGIGIVSGAAIHLVITRRLQLGDPGGHMKRGFDAFPFQEMAKRVYDKYFIPLGKKQKEPFRNPEMLTTCPSRELIELIVVSNFVEVFLAKEGHTGLIGINYLEKIQIPHIYSLYGAMLAGVDFVTVGAGIPTQFPAIMGKLANGEAVEYRLDVTDAEAGEFSMRFDPREFFSEYVLPELARPAFLPIISSNVLAILLNKMADLLVIEGSTAGGHNAGPRGKKVRNERGEPVYGPKDLVDLAKIRALEIPFILAGGYAHPEKYEEALQSGAAAVQVGSIGALSEDSDLLTHFRRVARAMAFTGKLDVFTSWVSPTGYPFKIAMIIGTLSDRVVYEKRPRICDLGFLRELYKREDGSLGYRCSAEPIEAYVKKGGKAEDCQGKACLCNCLPANIGLAQQRVNGYEEPALLTIGDDVSFVRSLMSGPDDSYNAEDAIRYICRVNA